MNLKLYIITIIAVTTLALIGSNVIATTISKTIVTNPNLESGLVGHWTFDGPDVNIGTNVITDRSGQGNNATTTGMDSATTTVSGVIGQAMDFDGIDDSMASINNTGVSGSQNRTNSFWFSADTDIQRTVVGMGIDGTFTKYSIQQEGSTSRGKIRVAINGGNNIWIFDFSDGGMHHLAIVLDGTDTSDLIAYGDGQLLSVDSTNDQTINTTDAPLMIAKDANAGVAGLDGKLDDVRIYDRALSAEEITRLYQLGATTHIAKTIETNPDLRTGLDIHYTFDGQTVDIGANTILDVSGNGETGSTVGMDSATTTISGAMGQAFDFDGVDDYVDTTFEPSYSTSDDFSYSVWFKAVDTNTIFGSQAESGSFDELVTMHIDSGAACTLSGEIKWDIHDDDNSNGSRDTLCSGVVLGDGAWHHAVGTYDVDGDMVFYADGQSTNSMAVTSNSNSGNKDFTSYPIYIGGKNNRGSPAGFLNGEIDDFRAYDYVLSSTTVARLYGLGATTHIATTITTNPDLENGLVGHWTFDGKDLINNATDRSGQGNNGYLTGFTSTTTTTGKLGQALDFDGVDDCVALGDPVSLQDLHLTGGMTVALWYKMDAGAEFDNFVSKRGGGGTGYWSIKSYAAASNGIDFNKDGSTNISIRTDTGILLNDTWSHFVLTWDGSVTATNVHIYTDNTEVTYTTQQDGASLISDVGEGIDIGGKGDCTSTFAGLMDDVRIYNRVLSADERSRLYDLGR